MKILFFASCLLIIPYTLMAEEKTIEIEWKVISCSKEIFESLHPTLSDSVDLNLQELMKVKGLNLQGLLEVKGVFIKDQVDQLLKNNENSADITTLPSDRVTSGKQSKVSNLVELSKIKLTGDTQRFSTRKFQVDPNEESATVGYSFMCTPSVQDEQTLHLDIELHIHQIIRFEETVLSGNLATTIAQPQNELTLDSYPKIRQPIIAHKQLTTFVTTYNESFVVFSIPRQYDLQEHDYILLSVKILD